jgi:uncharacterized Zn-finger protein
MFSETNPTPTLGRRIVQTPHQSQRPKSMSGSGYPKFRNDRAVAEIRIGVREFNCIGVSPPLDHPYVYINMGQQDAILYVYVTYAPAGRAAQTSAPFGAGAGRFSLKTAPSSRS